jgi:purine-binding chemotaxis protein CheW
MNPVREGTTSRLDWAQARQRLAQAIAALEEWARLPPEKAQAVLDERARVLARVPEAASGVAENLELVIFDLGPERYAVETGFVREVLRSPVCTPVPGAPEFVVGVMNLRGDIVAVFDIRRIFGMTPPARREGGAGSRVLVLGGERVEFGILADSVEEIQRLHRTALLETPGSVSGIAREYLRGVTADALIVLDGAVLLRDQRFFIDLEE